MQSVHCTFVLLGYLLSQTVLNILPKFENVKKGVIFTIIFLFILFIDWYEYLLCTDVDLKL